ncbi:hypothetical protein A2U01_0028248 [Trifolium medium]|uniref:Uncharacterized protein n=1 Tax=Trifolium medium TaxID=97028 RepID=A0A392P542_9FABA|nr:hypothetical protein [Trifolium medium]
MLMDGSTSNVDICKEGTIGDNVTNTTETHTHCEVPGSNPGEGVQPSNINIGIVS